MARNEESKKGATARVYRSGDVHRRRVDRKARPEASRPKNRLQTKEERPDRGSDRTRFSYDASPGDETTPLGAQEPSADVTQAMDPIAGEQRVAATSAEATQAIGPGAESPIAAADSTARLPGSPASPTGPGRNSGYDAADDAPDATGPIPAGNGEAPAFAPVPKRRSKGKAIAAVAAVVVVVALAVGGLFAWNRWFRFDDHADMQGEWYVVGTIVPVSIDEGSIRLTDDVTYDYTIDPSQKTISYTFGPMEGQGRYWFSEDRQYLVITDGDGYDASETAVDDLVRAFRDLGTAVSGGDLQLPEGEGIIAFSREPDAAAQAAKDEEERAKKEAAEKAAKEAKEAEEKAAKEAEEAEKQAAKEAEEQAQAAEAEAVDYYYDDTADEGDYYYGDGSEAEIADDGYGDYTGDATYDDGAYDGDYDYE